MRKRTSDRLSFGTRTTGWLAVKRDMDGTALGVAQNRAERKYTGQEAQVSRSAELPAAVRRVLGGRRPAEPRAARGEVIVLSAVRGVSRGPRPGRPIDPAASSPALSWTWPGRSGRPTAPTTARREHERRRTRRNQVSAPGALDTVPPGHTCRTRAPATWGGAAGRSCVDAPLRRGSCRARR